MTVLGRTNSKLDFFVCNQFEQTVLEGQLCYEFNFTLLGKEATKTGLENGLLLILDPGRSKNIPKSINPSQGGKITSMNLKPFKKDISSAKIHLNTLASFSNDRPGIYAMSVLKRMSGTDSLMALPDDSKECQKETFEKCQTERFFETIQKKCGCVPWALSEFITQKVE